MYYSSWTYDMTKALFRGDAGRSTGSFSGLTDVKSSRAAGGAALSEGRRVGGVGKSSIPERYAGTVSRPTHIHPPHRRCRCRVEFTLYVPVFIHYLFFFFFLFFFTWQHFLSLWVRWCKF